MYTWGTFFRVAGHLRILLASNPSCKTNLGYFFRVAGHLRILLASCKPKLQDKSGMESLGSRLGYYTVAAVCIYSYIQKLAHSHRSVVQAVAAIQTSLLQ